MSQELVIVPASSGEVAAAAPPTDPGPPPARYFANADYGHEAILRHYAGRTDKPINAVIPHGVCLEPNLAYEGEITAEVPAVLSWPPVRDAAYANTGVVAVPSASPFLYAASMAHVHVREPEGTLFFLQHATSLCHLNLDYDAIADSLADFPSPIRVCMHFCDIEMRRHEPFIERGYHVVTAGKQGDVYHTFRLIGLLKAHKLVLGGEIGSVGIYSTAIGVPYHLHEADGLPPKVWWPKIFRMSDAEAAEWQKLYDIWPHEHTPVTPELRDACMEVLGAGRMLSRTKLRGQFDWLDTLPMPVIIATDHATVMMFTPPEDDQCDTASVSQHATASDTSGAEATSSPTPRPKSKSKAKRKRRS